MIATSILQSTRSLIPFVPPARAKNHVSRLVAQSVGWLSLVLGALDLAAPARLAGRLGLTDRKTMRNVSIAVAAIGGIALLSMYVANSRSRRAKPRRRRARSH